MKKFNLKELLSPLLAPFNKKLPIVTEIKITMDELTLKQADTINYLRAKMVDQERKAIALESIIANLRKGRSGLLYYNPTNHSADTIKVIQIYGGWVIVSEKKGLRPVVLSEDEYKEFYGSYVVLPLIDNRAVGNYSDKIKTK